jgi:hypothetical protein
VLPVHTIPYARLRVWSAGAAGVTDDPGWAWYSPVCRDAGLWSGEWAYPFGSLDANTRLEAFRLLTLGERSSLIPIPYAYPWHMESARWTQNTGDWEERRVGNANFGYNMLYCLDTTGKITSTFTLPAQPSFCVEFCPQTCPSDYATHATPPFLEVSWGDVGGSRYTLMVGVEGTAYLSLDAGGGGAVALLGSAPTGWRWPTDASKAADGLQLCILHLCHGIVVMPSSNGFEPLFFAHSDGVTSLDAAAAALSVNYRGGSALVGVYGVLGLTRETTGSEYGAGATDLTLTSAWITTDRSRASGATAEYRGLIPAPASPEVAPDTAISGSNVGDQVQTVIDMTWGYSYAMQGGSLEGEQADFPFAYAFGHFPELYAVQVRHNPSVSVPASFAVEQYSGLLENVTVELPDEGDQASATFEALWQVQEMGGAFADSLYCKLADIALFWKYSDNSVDSPAVLVTGYISELETSQETPNRVRVRGSLVDIAAPARQVECDESWPVMDGWNAETAAVYVAAKCGWPAVRCDFSSCAGYTLSLGHPETPLWQGQAGSSGWDFLCRILRYCLQEIAVSPVGLAYSRDLMYFDTGTVHTWPATGARAAKLQRRNMFQYTGVEVLGQDLRGNPLRAWRADVPAEATVLYGLFRGFRRLERFEEAGFLTQAQCYDLADVLYASLGARTGDVLPVTFTVPTGTLPQRREMLDLTGSQLGVSGDWGIMGLTYAWTGRKPGCTITIRAVAT